MVDLARFSWPWGIFAVDVAGAARYPGGVDTRETVIEFMQARASQTVYGALGIEVVSYDPDAVSLRITMDDRHRQPVGLLHGGVSVLLAESAASVAAALSVDMSKVSVTGMEINANHVRRVSSGVVTAVARPVHRGASSHVYAIEVSDDADRLVCISRCTVAITPLRPGMLGLG